MILKVLPVIVFFMVSASGNVRTGVMQTKKELPLQLCEILEWPKENHFIEEPKRLVKIGVFPLSKFFYKMSNCTITWSVTINSDTFVPHIPIHPR